jgi:Tfp pilus assembly protein PilF
LKKAIEIDPKLSIAFKWLSEAYIKKGDIELARKTAEKAKELGLNVQDGSK